MSTVSTLGEAWRAGWQITARCTENQRTWGSWDKKCPWQRSLDMVTLMATRGEGFPLTLLASRLRCPTCGNRKVTVLFHLPRSITHGPAGGGRDAG